MAKRDSQRDREKKRVIERERDAQRGEAKTH